MNALSFFGKRPDKICPIGIHTYFFINICVDFKIIQILNLITNSKKVTNSKKGSINRSQCSPMQSCTHLLESLGLEEYLSI